MNWITNAASTQSLCYMRQFISEYKAMSILQQLVGEFPQRQALHKKLAEGEG